MESAITYKPRINRPDLALVWGSIAAAWIVTMVLVVTGEGAYLVDHDAVLEGRRFGWTLTILLFIAAWQLMTAAMMLPSSMPMMAMFLRVSRRHPQPRRSFGVFLLGYFAVWTGFAIAALVGDAGMHWLERNVSAIAARPWLIGGSVLVVAGVFQFSSLKEQCLDTCRDPLTFFWHHYLAGSRSAWRLGIRHGLFCLGCCWALMLTMFAVGMGSVVWMTALAGIMVIEKVTRYGNRLAHPIGLVLVAWGVLVMLDPGWLPAFAGVA
jgi:predicted metal-binding membrane protein